MAIHTTYLNPNDEAHKRFYEINRADEGSYKLPGTVVLSRMRNILSANHGDKTRDVYYAVEAAIQKIYRYGSYADAVQLIRAGYCSHAWHPEMSR